MKTLWDFRITNNFRIDYIAVFAFVLVYETTVCRNGYIFLVYVCTPRNDFISITTIFFYDTIC